MLEHCSTTLMLSKQKLKLSLSLFSYWIKPHENNVITPKVSNFNNYFITKVFPRAIKAPQDTEPEGRSGEKERKFIKFVSSASWMILFSLINDDKLFFLCFRCSPLIFYSWRIKMFLFSPRLALECLSPSFNMFPFISGGDSRLAIHPNLFRFCWDNFRE